MAEEREGPDEAEAEATDADRIALAALILELRQRGIHDRRVLSVIEAIPRRFFLDRAHQKLAYRDAALPIECGQTISQPTVVAMMTEALKVGPGHAVLEIGTGSGYQTAVLARLAGSVVSLERYRSLAVLARQRLAALHADNAEILVADGTAGHPDGAPYDRILVTAAAREVPPALLDQLPDGGVLVAPVGPPGGVQRLVRVTRRGEGTETERLAGVRFVPLQPGVAEHL